MTRFTKPKLLTHLSRFFELLMALTAGACPLLADDGIMGFANYADLGCQGVTGGMDGQIVHVSTLSDLAAKAKSSSPLTIVIDEGFTGSGTVSIASHKTIIGHPSIQLNGVYFDAKNQQNIVLRNIWLTKGAPDGLAFRNCHHVWVDHCDLSDCSDGLLDFTIGSSYLTLSWSALHDHNKVSLSCSGTMHYEDNFKNRVSYHHNHFYNGTQRNPRIGYGLGHLWNNYWNHNEFQDSWGYCIGFFNQAKVLVENSYFTDVKTPFQNMYTVYDYDSSYADLESRGNEFGSGVSGDRNGTGKSFDVSLYYDYAFAMESVSSVKDYLRQDVGPQDWVVDDLYGFPGNGAIRVSNLGQLKWSPVENVAYYRLQFGTDPANLPVVQQSDQRTFALHNLNPATTYYWKVTAVKNDSSGCASSVWRFTTGGDKATQPFPANGATDYAVYEAYPHEGVTMETCGGFATEAGKLSWMPAVYAKRYHVYLDTTDVDMAKIGESTSPVFQPSAPLKLGQTYYWRVDTEDYEGQLMPGDVWSFSSKNKSIREGKNEAESLVMFGQTYKEWENGSVNWGYKASGNYVTSGEAGTGTLAGTYIGRSGTCTVTYCYFDEKQGQGSFQLRVNNKPVGKFTGNKNTNALEQQSFTNVVLHKGDQLAFDFLMADKMKCRMDYVNIKVDEVLDDLDAPSTNPRLHDGRIYNLMGQEVDENYRGLVIINGQKMLLK